MIASEQWPMNLWIHQVVVIRREIVESARLELRRRDVGNFSLLGL